LFQISQLPRNIEAALRDSEAKNVDVRKSAVTDLVLHVGGEAKPRVVNALRRILRTDSDAEVRALAAIACADAGISELLPELFDALTEPSPRVTQMALLAIGELSVRSSDVDVLRVSSFLRSELPALRYQSLLSLYRMRATDVYPELWRAIHDFDVELQWLGWHLLDDWYSKPDAPSRARGECATERDHCGFLPKLRQPERVQELFFLAEKATPKVRLEATLLLLRFDEAEAWRILRSLLERPRTLESGQVERAVRRLGSANCRSSVPWLLKRARVGWFEGMYGWTAICALAQLGESAARATIIAELGSSSSRRRHRALEAVRSLHLVEAISIVEKWVKIGTPETIASEVQSVLEELRGQQIARDVRST
jgi:hypothetical protein